MQQIGECLISLHCVLEIYGRSSGFKIYSALVLVCFKNSCCCCYFPLLSTCNPPLHRPQTHDPAAVLHVCSLLSPWCSVTTFTWQETGAETGDWPAVRTVPNCVRQLMHPADTGLLPDIWSQPVMLPYWVITERTTSCLLVFSCMICVFM